MSTKTIVGVSSDGRSIVVQIDGEDGPLAHSVLDPSTASELIRGLAITRAQLPEKIAPSLEPNARIEVEAWPAWNIPATHSGPPSVLLTLRHSGLGWLGFTLDAETAERIGQALIQRASDLIGSAASKGPSE